MSTEVQIDITSEILSLLKGIEGSRGIVHGVYYSLSAVKVKRFYIKYSINGVEYGQWHSGVYKYLQELISDEELENRGYSHI